MYLLSIAFLGCFLVNQIEYNRPLSSFNTTVMVWDLVRDSTFGHLVRLATKGKVFKYDEEIDPNLWKKFVNEEKSGYIAHHGTADPPENDTDSLQGVRGVRTREADSETSSKTEIDDGNTYNEASGVKVDPEKGKDKSVIDWYGPEDPDVSTVLHYTHSTLLTLNRIQGTGRRERSSS